MESSLETKHSQILPRIDSLSFAYGDWRDECIQESCPANQTQSLLKNEIENYDRGRTLRYTTYFFLIAIQGEQFEMIC